MKGASTVRGEALGRPRKRRLASTLRKPARGLREARQGRIEPGPAHKAGRPALSPTTLSQPSQQAQQAQQHSSTAAAQQHSSTAGSVPIILTAVIPDIIIRHFLDSRIIRVAVGIGVIAVRVGDFRLDRAVIV